MKPTLDSVAKLLAAEHMQDDTSIQAVISITNDIEVRLIEITPLVPATGEVLPFRFTPDLPDVPYTYVVAQLHPDDWRRKGELDWPELLSPLKNSYKCVMLRSWMTS